MFKILYAASVLKDLKKIDKRSLRLIKKRLEELRNFPNVPNIKHLSSHPLADYRMRVGNYRILFDVNWEKKEIYVLKVGHRKDVY